MSRYQKDKTNLDFTEARDSEWQWHQLCCMQVRTSLQTVNHTSTPPLRFLQAGCPSCRPNQQRQSTEGTSVKTVLRRNVVHDEGFGAGVKTTRACVCVSQPGDVRSASVGGRYYLSSSRSDICSVNGSRVVPASRVVYRPSATLINPRFNKNKQYVPRTSGVVGSRAASTSYRAVPPRSRAGSDWR